MYKILIKYTSSSSNELWKFHGTTTSTSSVSGSDSTFTVFETDDLTTLEAEVKKLDMELGHAYIKVIKEIDYDVLVDVADDDNQETQTSEEGTENNETV